jgi:hypothetical protein
MYGHDPSPLLRSRVADEATLKVILEDWRTVDARFRTAIPGSPAAADFRAESERLRLNFHRAAKALEAARPPAAIDRPLSESAAR